MSRLAKCSSCGSSRDLHLVTAPYSPESDEGRTLVYCLACRNESNILFGVSIPIELVTPDVFLHLYRLGKTSSQPDTAVEIVFGEIDQRLIEQANQIRAQ